MKRLLEKLEELANGAADYVLGIDRSDGEMPKSQLAPPAEMTFTPGASLEDQLESLRSQLESMQDQLNDPNLPPYDPHSFRRQITIYQGQIAQLEQEQLTQTQDEQQ
jgi:hypothetical protein